MNVLIVDDSAVIRLMVRKAMRLTGLQVDHYFEASNGREGLACLELNPIHLALVDLSMPVMNGEEMIDRIRENPRNAAMPIIVISTESSQTRIDRIQEKGIEFVHKPFGPEKLRDVVQRLLGGTHVFGHL